MFVFEFELSCELKTELDHRSRAFPFEPLIGVGEAVAEFAIDDVERLSTFSFLVSVAITSDRTAKVRKSVIVNAATRSLIDHCHGGIRYHSP